jgi:hypothetical protein
MFNSEITYIYTCKLTYTWLFFPSLKFNLTYYTAWFLSSRWWFIKTFMYIILIILNYEVDLHFISFPTYFDSIVICSELSVHLVLTLAFNWISWHVRMSLEMIHEMRYSVKWIFSYFLISKVRFFEFLYKILLKKKYFFHNVLCLLFIGIYILSQILMIH